MKLSELDDVTVLRNYRRNAAKIRGAALTGPFAVTVWNDLDPFAFIEAGPIRQAVYDELGRFVAEQERKLRELGVTVDEDS